MSGANERSKDAPKGEPTPGLGRELACVLLVKFVALAVLWFAFFHAPDPAEPTTLFTPAHQPDQESTR